MNVDQQIAKAMNKVYTMHKSLVRQTAIRAFGNIGINTPVDTGFARLNWNISVGSVDTSVKPKPGKDETFAAPDFASKAASALASYDGKQTIYISNHLPYIVRLNEGYSKQAPSNFVETSLMLAKRQAERGQK